jgi:hypothetical protein
MTPFKYGANVQMNEMPLICVVNVALMAMINSRNVSVVMHLITAAVFLGSSRQEYFTLNN